MPCALFLDMVIKKTDTYFGYLLDEDLITSFKTFALLRSVNFLTVVAIKYGGDFIFVIMGQLSSMISVFVFVC